ncbi:MAG TPA: tetratricopeptide repeat protein [Microcoleaceae cyanobacterium]|jgi:tetratricopeptide (TPR) repeat protein
MLDQVATAFEQQDYKAAARLVQELLQRSPQDPWVQFYLGRLQEVSQKLETAETTYRQLLRNTTNPKLMTQVRQGLQRLEAMRQEQRQAAIAQATLDPANQKPGCLVLQAVTGDLRPKAVQNLARVMHLDAYNARSILPGRGWRLYRMGKVGEIQVYGQELQRAEIPVFWSSLAAVEAIQVFQVNYFQAVSPQVTVICQNDANQLGSLTFNWSEVSQRVEGMLPVFEQVLELGYRDRLERKEQTQDYNHFCDLHLPGRNCILRLQDSRYEFHQGGKWLLEQPGRDRLDNTVRRNWNRLIALLDRHLPQTPVWSEFQVFGESTTDFALPLSRLNPHIHLFRDRDCYLDQAFHLYSSLIFLHNR